MLINDNNPHGFPLKVKSRVSLPGGVCYFEIKDSLRARSELLTPPPCTFGGVPGRGGGAFAVDGFLTGRHLLQGRLELPDEVVAAVRVVVEDLELELPVPVAVAELARGDLARRPLRVRVVLQLTVRKGGRERFPGLPDKKKKSRLIQTLIHSLLYTSVSLPSGLILEMV